MGYFGPQSNPTLHASFFLFLNVRSRFRTPSSPRLRFSCNQQRFLFIQFFRFSCKFFLFNRYRFLISRVTVVMANKRNLAPESSQLVEPPLKQHQSEAQQENIRVFGVAHTDSLLLDSLFDMPDFKYTSYDVQRQVVDTLMKKQEMEAYWKQELEALRANGHKPAFDFRGIGPFGRGIPTSVPKKVEAVGGFGYPLPTREVSESISVVSHPTITEEHGGTSGQTAYNYERFESCVAIAGADYCVIVVDFPRDHTKISQLSGKCVMAACRGFQANMEALQVLSVENLKYEGQHKKPMSCPEMYRLYRRVQQFHPIYDFILLGGLDSEGKGCIFQHFRDDDDDARQVGYSSQDYGSRPIVPPPIPPILKNELPTQDVLAQLSEIEALNLAKDVFASTTNTGDKLEIVVLNVDGLTRYCEDLKRNNSAVRFNC